MVRRWISENTNCFSLGHKELLIPPRCPSGWTCVLGTCLCLWPIGSEGLYSTPRALSVVKSPQKKWGKQSSRICIESVMPEPSRASLMVDMFPKWPRDQSENESQNTTSAKSCFKMQPELPWWLNGKKKKKKRSACLFMRNSFKPWSGKIPQAREHLSWGTTTIDLCSRAWKLQLLSPRATAAEACMPWSPCTATREAAAVRSPLTTTRE